jgi:general secretion pathway protein A
LNAAGNKGKTAIKKNAVKRIYQLSKGNFRQVNILMDRCLYVGFLRNTTEISKGIVNGAYEDLSPDTSPNFGRALVVGASTLVALCVIGGIIYSRSYLNTPRETVSLSSHITASTGGQLASRTKQSVGSQESGAIIPAPQKVDELLIVSGPVGDFLRAYHLSEYEEAFFDASKTHQYQQVSETIFEQTGLRLIQLEYIPDRIRERYGVLAYPSASGGKERYFLFWRPRLRLREFYLGYYGEEVRMLQEMLSTGNFYNDQPDGTVGENLMKAVLIFQAQMGLPVTGFPDERTIFLLCHLRGAAGHDS